MKWILILTSLPFSLLYSQTNDYTFHTLYRTFEKGSQPVVLVPNAPVYNQLDTNRTLQSNLPIGTPLKILTRMQERAKMNGFLTNWYQVAYTYQDSVQQGYIWGGHIAVNKAIAKKDTTISFVYGIAKIGLVDRGGYQDQSILLQVNAYKNNQLLDGIEVEAAGNIYTQTQLLATGNRGLRNVREVLELAFSDGYCGGVSAEAVVFWTGRKLYDVRLLSNGFSDKQFSSQYFIYPSDAEGRNQLIVARNESGAISTQNRRKVTQQTEQVYLWNGQELYLITEEK